MKFYDEFNEEEQVVIEDLFQQVSKGNFKRDERVTFLSILVEEDGADGKVVRYNATKRGINVDKIDGRVVCIEGFVFDVHHFVVWFSHKSVTQY